VLNRHPPAETPCPYRELAPLAVLLASNYSSGRWRSYSGGTGVSRPYNQLLSIRVSVHPYWQTSPHVHRRRIFRIGRACLRGGTGHGREVVYEQDGKPAAVRRTGRSAAGGSPRHLAYGKDDAGWLVTELGIKFTV
jgi:6-phosphogluconolactonase (cycloisomerase 2 family)